ncbi:polyamine transporter 1 [Byssothecium circinans]|uniref:Polyamine transporter 1 n=1 Tax=Byssothecium circinans TaxID=147558 RepID=A0A6A5U3G0_9PLEO|nr:polyamine transporter 1 [Byssothecium circinans]
MRNMETSSNNNNWDDPNNIDNPMNWPDNKKRMTTSLISLTTFLASMAATIFAPGVPLLMHEFASTNQELAAFLVSVYIIGFGIGPLVLAPMSELWGRAILLHCSNIGMIISSVACAVSSNLGMFIFFRLMMGIAGCIPVTIGGGVIADIVPPEKRGAAMSVWGMGLVAKSSTGPVIGGYLAEGKGWRWIFWLLTILSGVLTILSFMVLRETYAPVLLQRSAKRSRKDESSDSPDVSPIYERSPTQLFLQAIIRPSKLMVFSPVAGILALFISVHYSYLYFLFTTFTPVFENQYGFSTGEAGLAFLGMGIGLVLGVFSVGFYAKKYTETQTLRPLKPEDRLPPVILGASLFPAGLIWYGWTAHYRVHWIVPMIGTSFVGYGGTLLFLPVQMYLADAFQLYSASAIATNTIARNLIGATIPLAGGKLYGSLGLGWGNTLLGLICVVVIPVPVLLMKYGERLRTSEKFQVKL